MADSRQYPFGQRPAVMFTTTGTLAHLRETGTHTGLCGEFVDIHMQGETGMDTLQSTQTSCPDCVRIVVERAEAL